MIIYIYTHVSIYYTINPHAQSSGDDAQQRQGLEGVQAEPCTLAKLAKRWNVMVISAIDSHGKSLKLEVSSWENHPFLWAIYTMAMLVNQRVIIHYCIYEMVKH